MRIFCGKEIWRDCKHTNKKVLCVENTSVYTEYQVGKAYTVTKWVEGPHNIVTRKKSGQPQSGEGALWALLEEVAMFDPKEWL